MNRPIASLPALVWRLVRPGLLLGCGLVSAGGVVAATYTSASTAYSLIDSSSHSKVGYGTSPYKFNAATGCGSIPPILDDTLSDLIPLGFSFTYGGGSYTGVYISSNGRLQFANTTCGYGTANPGPPQTYPYGYPDAGMNATMKVFGVDLDHTNLVDKPNYPAAGSKTPCLSSASCYVSVATLGSAPTRQFVVTWKHVPEWVTANNTSGSFDLQAILNEDGSFVFQYGTISHGGTGTAQIGWQLSVTDYAVLSFGASSEPSAFSAIKFFLPAPLASYRFDESAWVPGLAGQIADSSGNGRPGLALGAAQTASTGHACRAAGIPALAAGAAVSAVQTGVDLGNSSLNLQGTGTIAFWYRANAAWVGSAAQLLDATATSGQWFYLSKTAAGKLVFEITDSSGAVRSVSTAAQSFAAGTWVHIAASWNFNGSPGINQDSLQISVNAGTPVVSAFTSSGAVTAAASWLAVGGNPSGLAATNGSPNSANGLIDELAIYNYVMSPAQVNAEMNSGHGCPSYVIDHLQLEHASGNGLTCNPSTLTIRACQNAACSSLYTGGISGMLSATGSATLNWDSNSGNASGAGFVIAAGSSTVAKSFQLSSVGSTLLGIAALSPAANNAGSCNFGAPSCTFSSADSGFILSLANQVAEQAGTLSLTAVKKSDSSPACVPGFANVAKSVTLACAYLNPASGSLPVRVASTALNGSGDSAAACDAGGRAISLNFDAGGVATASLLYADVGSVALSARYAPSGGTGTEAGLVMVGSTQFIVKPAGFGLSAIRCSTYAPASCAPALAAPGNNPGASDANGPAFIQAGANFSVTVSALNAAGAVTPNFGSETVAEGVTLGSSLLAPAGGHLASLVNPSGFGAFSQGVASGNSFSWSEVGALGLTPRLADGDYLGSGDVATSPTVAVGRFIPARLMIAGPSLIHRASAACSPAASFSYLGEPFRLGFAASAQNLAGGITQNYSGSFAKLDPAVAANWQLAGIAGTTVFKTSGSAPRLALGSASGSWSQGQASAVTLYASALRGSGADGPFDARFGIAPVDSDGIGLASLDLDTDTPANGNDRSLLATVTLRLGRLRLMNAIGSQLRPLKLPLLAQYWDGSAWSDNTLDSCTQLPASAVNLGNLRKSLVSADARLASGTLTLAAGRASLQLAAPGAGHSGSLDLALSLGGTATDASCLQVWAPGSGAASAGAGLAHLRGAWCGSTLDKDPSARASFGLFRGADNFIDQRENY